jgi:hypothetical protein
VENAVNHVNQVNGPGIIDFAHATELPGLFSLIFHRLRLFVGLPYHSQEFKGVRNLDHHFKNQIGRAQNPDLRAQKGHKILRLTRLTRTYAAAKVLQVFVLLRVNKFTRWKSQVRILQRPPIKSIK